MPAGIIFNVSRSLAAHETIYNRTNHVFQSKDIGGHCHSTYFRILIYRFLSKWVFSDKNLISFTVMT